MGLSADSVWLITGCSSGFGKELVLAALTRGFRVIATARRLEALHALASAGAATMHLDVTDSDEAITQFAKEALKVYGQIDVLVSNAGYCQAGAIEETTHDQRLAQFATNFFGVINVTNAFLPHFRARCTGTIVNISSMGGILNNSGCGVYCASKAALDSISDVWSRELRGFGIRCVSIQPGAFATDVGSATNFKTPQSSIDGYDMAHSWMSMMSQGAGGEPGDPKKGVLRILDLVSQDTLPLRFALGDDAYELITVSHQEVIDSYKSHEIMSKGTNADNVLSATLDVKAHFAT